MDLHCTRCQIALPPDSVRCPRCLRTSTLVDRAARRDAGPIDEEPGESYVLMRLVVLGAAWLFAALASWLMWPQKAWLEPHHLWLSALLWVGSLWLLPLRAAFRAPKTEAGPREALRSLGLLTAQVIGLGTAFALVIAGLSQLTDSTMLVLTGGLALFIGSLVMAPALILALRGKRPFAEVVPALGKAALAVVLVCALMALAVLRSEPRAEHTLTIPTVPEALQEILDAQNVPVTSSRERQAAGTVVNLRADGGTFERTLMRLKSATLSALVDMKDEPNVVIKLWFPGRFERANAEQARDEIAALRNGVERANRSKASAAVEVHFGDPPQR